MRINPIQFNFIRNKPQKVVSSPLHINKGLQADTVSFSSNRPEFYGWDKLEQLKPKHKGIIYKKVRDENGNIVKNPIEVDIVNCGCGIFHFQQGKKVIGGVDLAYIPAEECDKNPYAALSKTYKYEDIVGDRIEVLYIYNNCESEYCGIGHLSDLVEVAACKELGIKPNIISYSFEDVAPLHYKRGKRFIPYEKYLSQREMNSYGLNGKYPNATVKDIIENTPKGKNFDTSPIPLQFLLMYMPKSMAKELEEELKEHPIF